MALDRWTVRGMIPASILVGLALTGAMAGGVAKAQAAPTTTPSPDRPLPKRLPEGIHRRLDGRYVKDVCKPNQHNRRCLAQQVLPEPWQPDMEIPDRVGIEATGSPMAPADVLTAYSVPASSAAKGKIVAILDAPDSQAFADVTGYRAQNKLPVLPKCSGMPTGTTACFAQINEDGTPSTGADSGNDDFETALDMAMISAACPDCAILLVEINANFCETDFSQGVATATKLGASAISISIGGPEWTDPNYANVPATDGGTDPCPNEDSWVNDLPYSYSTPGHLVFVASGDFAYNNVNIGLSATIGGASPSYPSSSPYVVSVGGTALYSSGGKYSEGVWDDGKFGLFEGTSATSAYQDVTTSGCSTEFAMPSWQASVLAGSGCTMRATADISAAATFFSGGKEAYIGLYQGGYTAASGTSASAPLVAALFTRLGLTDEASNDLGWMYENPSAFNDVGSTAYPIPSGGKSTDAPATASCGILCKAGTGWDGPTGVGTPNGTALAALPVSTSGPVPYPDAGVPGPPGTSSGTPDSGTVTTPDAGTTKHDAGGGTNATDSGGGNNNGGGDDSGTPGTGDNGGGDDAGGAPITIDDGGTPVTGEDGSTGLGDEPGAPSSSGCSCVAAGSSPGSAGFAALSAVVGLAGLGARRRRRQGSAAQR